MFINFWNYRIKGSHGTKITTQDGLRVWYSETELPESVFHLPAEQCNTAWLRESGPGEFPSLRHVRDQSRVSEAEVLQEVQRTGQDTHHACFARWLLARTDKVTWFDAGETWARLVPATPGVKYPPL